MSYALFELVMDIAEGVGSVVSAAGAVVKMYLKERAKSLSAGNSSGIVGIDPAEIENMVRDYDRGLNLQYAVSLDMLGEAHPRTASELAREYGTSEEQLSSLRKEINDSLLGL
ncbi:hypothetical protein KY360_04845 [Candidatus Woesearchaeota archaeon]|nr:hypothetical protein [Candidatus Woesearchaeota archaeon]